MHNSISMRLSGAWIAVEVASAIKDHPVRAHFLGIPIVLWRDSAHRVVAFEDRCPHKGASLSLGWTVGDDLICRYHGRRFERDGSCKDSVGNNNCLRAETFLTSERGGLVWVTRSGAEDLPEALSIPKNFCIHYVIDEIAHTNAFNVLDNAFDTDHFATTHPQTFGVRTSKSGCQPIFCETDFGFCCEYRVPIVARGEFEAFVGNFSGSADVSMFFFAPLTHLFNIKFANGTSYSSLQTVSPLHDDACRFFQVGYGSPESSFAARSAFQDADMAVWREDKIILETIRGDVLQPHWDAKLGSDGEPHSVQIARAVMRKFEAMF